MKPHPAEPNSRPGRSLPRPEASTGRPSITLTEILLPSIKAAHPIPHCPMDTGRAVKPSLRGSALRPSEKGAFESPADCLGMKLCGTVQR